MNTELTDLFLDDINGLRKRKNSEECSYISAGEQSRMRNTERRSVVDVKSHKEWLYKVQESFCRHKERANLIRIS